MPLIILTQVKHLQRLKERTLLPLPVYKDEKTRPFPEPFSPALLCETLDCGKPPPAFKAILSSLLKKTPLSWVLSYLVTIVQFPASLPFIAELPEQVSYAAPLLLLVG